MSKVGRKLHNVWVKPDPASAPPRTVSDEVAAGVVRGVGQLLLWGLLIAGILVAITMMLYG